MTEEQKRFKIEKKTEYEELVSSEEKSIVFSSLLLAFISCFFIALSAAEKYFGGNVSRDMLLMGSLLRFNGVLFSIAQLRDIIQSICKKAGLEGKIEDINAELEQFEKGEAIKEDGGMIK